MRISVESLDYKLAPFRVPFKFGAATVTELILPHVNLRMKSGAREATGLGAMPMGNAWSYPGVAYNSSLEAMRRMVDTLASRISDLELPDDILTASFELRELAFDVSRTVSSEMFHAPDKIPPLCTLVCFSPFDIALFDAWGRLHDANTWSLLRSGEARIDLSQWLGAEFKEWNLSNVVSQTPAKSISIFHVVGGLDPLTPDEIAHPVDDGLPEDLQSWIARDGLTHFKIKLRGNDPDWDYERILAVDRVCANTMASEIATPRVYSLDCNEQCPSGQVVLDLLRRLQREAPAVLDRIAFVEQPTSRDFSGDKEKGLDEAALIKPIVVDEGLTDIPILERALSLGYNGICLKACKGIGFSLLAAAVARRRGLYLCAQDLTCPGESFLASASLAAWTGMDALEANARQYCPAANDAAAGRRPEVFQLIKGQIGTGGFTGIGIGMK